ncbi:hypothetical protein OHC33_007944 [Knufia fluminis]|uniref:Uncharacterized protein n=1 Tax=Knufia fluminis TaxID=191047 RepID=A0AAN8EGC9_9EURO|nr:hypothetical protein OHC33_007944 [Knufia fluminis]
MSEPDEDVVLITSAVFWMHDNVVHNSRTAMVHLQGFLRILTERKLRKGGTWQGDWENTLLTGLVFSADSVDDALAETLLPDLMHSIRQRLDDSTYLRSFNNISAAWEELRIGLAAIPYSWAEYGLREHNVTFPQSEARMEHVLSLVETLDVSSVAQAPLGKDLALPILPVVTHVWSVPTSMELRRRFFRVLRALHRIEGLWSSDVVADTVATAYSMEEGTDARTNQHPTELVHRGLRARNDMYLAGMNEDEAAYMGVWMPADSRAITHQNIPGITGITNPATLEGQVEKTVRNYRLGGGLANGSYLFDEALSIGNATR